MALIKCCKCSETYSDSLLKCPHCGFEPTVFVCPECGRLHNINAKSCAYCGMDLEEKGKIPATQENIEQEYRQLLAEKDESKTSKSLSKVCEGFILLGDYEDAEKNAADLQKLIETLKEEEWRSENFEKAKNDFLNSEDLWVQGNALNYLKQNMDYKDAKEILENSSEEYSKKAYEYVEENAESALKVEDLEKLIQLLSYISPYNDSEEKLRSFNEKKEQLEKSKKKKKKIYIGSACAVIVLSIAGFMIYNYVNPKEAREVKKSISSVQTITLDSKEELDQISAAYNALDSRAKKAVSNYEDLEKDYEEYYQVYVDDLNERIDKISGKTITLSDETEINTLLTRYDGLDENLKEQVINKKSLDKAKKKVDSLRCDAIVEEIKEYKNDGVDQIYTLIQQNADLLKKYDKYSECMLWYGEWNSLELVEEYIITSLKNPSSYHRTGGRFTGPFEDTSDQYYIYWTIEYTGTNSFGATVSDTAHAKVYLVVDDDGNVSTIVDHVY